MTSQMRTFRVSFPVTVVAEDSHGVPDVSDVTLEVDACSTEEAVRIVAGCLEYYVVHQFEMRRTMEIAYYQDER